MNGWCEEGIELGLGSWWGGVDMVRGEEEVVGAVGCEEVGSDGCGDGFI